MHVRKDLSDFQEGASTSKDGYTHQNFDMWSDIGYLQKVFSVQGRACF